MNSNSLLSRRVTDIENDSKEMLNSSSDYLSLFEACKNGDLKLVQKLIDKTRINLKLNSYYYYGNRKSTFLHFACGFGRRDVVQYLLSCGADPSQRDEG